MGERTFFTIGYEILGVKRFIEILKQNGVKTLLDSRHNPFSRNPDFRQKKLVSHLEQNDIRYEHLKDYGIPSDIRKTGEPLEWYIKNVKPKINASIIKKVRATSVLHVYGEGNRPLPSQSHPRNFEGAGA